MARLGQRDEVSTTIGHSDLHSGEPLLLDVICDKKQSDSTRLAEYSYRLSKNFGILNPTVISSGEYHSREKFQHFVGLCNESNISYWNKAI